MDANPRTPARTISQHDFRSLVARFPRPQILDVRREPAFERDRTLIPGAVRCPPDEVAAIADALEPWRPVIAVCVHGHEVSQTVARALRERGVDARHLAGGLAAWIAADAPLDPKPAGATTRWITRERPKIDRIACPWLVTRFVDARGLGGGPDKQAAKEPTQ